MWFIWKIHDISVFSLTFFFIFDFENESFFDFFACWFKILDKFFGGNQRLMNIKSILWTCGSSLDINWIIESF